MSRNEMRAKHVPTEFALPGKRSQTSNEEKLLGDRAARYNTHRSKISNKRQAEDANGPLGSKNRSAHSGKNASQIKRQRLRKIKIKPIVAARPGVERDCSIIAFQHRTNPDNGQAAHPSVAGITRPDSSLRHGQTDPNAGGGNNSTPNSMLGSDMQSTARSDNHAEFETPSRKSASPGNANSNRPGDASEAAQRTIKIRTSMRPIAEYTDAKMQNPNGPDRTENAAQQSAPALTESGHVNIDTLLLTRRGVEQFFEESNKHNNLQRQLIKSNPMQGEKMPSDSRYHIKNILWQPDQAKGLLPCLWSGPDNSEVSGCVAVHNSLLRHPLSPNTSCMAYISAEKYAALKSGVLRPSDMRLSERNLCEFCYRYTVGRAVASARANGNHATEEIPDRYVLCGEPGEYESSGCHQAVETEGRVYPLGILGWSRIFDPSDYAPVVGLLKNAADIEPFEILDCNAYQEAQAKNKLPKHAGIRYGWLETQHIQHLNSNRLHTVEQVNPYERRYTEPAYEATVYNVLRGYFVQSPEPMLNQCARIFDDLPKTVREISSSSLKQEAYDRAYRLVFSDMGQRWPFVRYHHDEECENILYQVLLDRINIAVYLKENARRLYNIEKTLEFKLELYIDTHLPLLKYFKENAGARRDSDCTELLPENSLQFAALLPYDKHLCEPQELRYIPLHKRVVCRKKPLQVCQEAYCNTQRLSKPYVLPEECLELVKKLRPRFTAQRTTNTYDRKIREDFDRCNAELGLFGDYDLWKIPPYVSLQKELERNLKASVAKAAILWSLEIKAQKKWDKKERPILLGHVLQAMLKHGDCTEETIEDTVRDILQKITMRSKNFFDKDVVSAMACIVLISSENKCTDTVLQYLDRVPYNNTNENIDAYTPEERLLLSAALEDQRKKNVSSRRFEHPANNRAERGANTDLQKLTREMPSLSSAGLLELFEQHRSPIMAEFKKAFQKSHLVQRYKPNTETDIHPPESVLKRMKKLGEKFKPGKKRNAFWPLLERILYEYKELLQVASKEIVYWSINRKLKQYFQQLKSIAKNINRRYMQTAKKWANLALQDFEDTRVYVAENMQVVYAAIGEDNGGNTPERILQLLPSRYDPGEITSHYINGRPWSEHSILLTLLFRVHIAETLHSYEYTMRYEERQNLVLFRNSHFLLLEVLLDSASPTNFLTDASLMQKNSQFANRFSLYQMHYPYDTTEMHPGLLPNYAPALFNVNWTFTGGLDHLPLIKSMYKLIDRCCNTRGNSNAWCKYHKSSPAFREHTIMQLELSLKGLYRENTYVPGFARSFDLDQIFRAHDANMAHQARDAPAPPTEHHKDAEEFFDTLFSEHTQLVHDCTGEGLLYYLEHNPALKHELMAIFPSWFGWCVHGNTDLIRRSYEADGHFEEIKRRVYGSGNLRSDKIVFRNEEPDFSAWLLRNMKTAMRQHYAENPDDISRRRPESRVSPQEKMLVNEVVARLEPGAHFNSNLLCIFGIDQQSRAILDELHDIHCYKLQRMRGSISAAAPLAPSAQNGGKITANRICEKILELKPRQFKLIYIFVDSVVRQHSVRITRIRNADLLQGQIDALLNRSGAESLAEVPDHIASIVFCASCSNVKTSFRQKPRRIVYGHEETYYDIQNGVNVCHRPRNRTSKASIAIQENLRKIEDEEIEVDDEDLPLDDPELGDDDDEPMEIDDDDDTNHALDEKETKEAARLRNRQTQNAVQQELELLRPICSETEVSMVYLPGQIVALPTSKVPRCKKHGKRPGTNTLKPSTSAYMLSKCCASPVTFRQHYSRPNGIFQCDSCTLHAEYIRSFNALRCELCSTVLAQNSYVLVELFDDLGAQEFRIVAMCTVHYEPWIAGARNGAYLSPTLRTVRDVASNKEAFAEFHGLFQ